MLIRDIRIHVIRPTLEQIGLYSQSAEILLAGTILCESNCDYLKQIGGPALSFYQIEPETFKSINMYLRNRLNKNLADRVLASCFTSYIVDTPEILMWNLRLATCYARLVYYRHPMALPVFDDAAGLARMHKVAYNTMLGKADPSKNISIFRKVIDDYKDK